MLSGNNMALSRNNMALSHNNMPLSEDRKISKILRKKLPKNLDNSKIFCTFVIVIEITIATIDFGSEKPEQTHFSLALRDGCNIEIKRDFGHPM